MAELLVDMIGTVHPDPVKNRLSGERGYVITVKEDGAPWGRLETVAPRDGGRYAILKLPGVPAADLKYMEEPEYDDFVPSQEHRKRANKIDIDALPAAIVSDMTNIGERLTNLTTLEPRIVLQKTGAVRVSL